MKKLPIVIDTREQNPLDFSPFEDVRTVRAELWPGDYSLQAATRMVAVERKSVSDLVGTMTGGYAGFGATTPKRFDRELTALGSYPRRGGRAFVLVEPDVRSQTAEEQIRAANYRAMIQPEKVMAFIQSIRDNWLVDVVLAESREHAAEIVVAAVRPFASYKAVAREIAKSEPANTQAVLAKRPATEVEVHNAPTGFVKPCAVCETPSCAIKGHDHLVVCDNFTEKCPF